MLKRFAHQLLLATLTTSIILFRTCRRCLTIFKSETTHKWMCRWSTFHRVHLPLASVSYIGVYHHRVLLSFKALGFLHNNAFRNDQTMMPSWPTNQTLRLGRFPGHSISSIGSLLEAILTAGYTAACMALASELFLGDPRPDCLSHHHFAIGFQVHSCASFIPRGSAKS
jgi:hypothetical protein